MWKWLDHIGDFAVKNLHVLRDAWVPFLIWCAIAAAGIWFIQGKIYDNQIANLQSDKGTLTTRVGVLDGEVRDLNTKLADTEKKASQASGSSRKPERDPDTLYQVGRSVARVYGGQIDRASGAVSFLRVLGSGDFNIEADAEFRELRIGSCKYGNYGAISSFGVTTQISLADVTCRILGLHP